MDIGNVLDLQMRCRRTVGIEGGRGVGHRPAYSTTKCRSTDTFKSRRLSEVVVFTLFEPAYSVAEETIT